MNEYDTKWIDKAINEAFSLPMKVLAAIYVVMIAAVVIIYDHYPQNEEPKTVIETRDGELYIKYNNELYQLKKV